MIYNGIQNNLNYYGLLATGSVTTTLPIFIKTN